MEKKIQEEAQKNFGRALSQNALKCGLTALAPLFGPAGKPVEALGKLFLEREEVKGREVRKVQMKAILDFLLKIESAVNSLTEAVSGSTGPVVDIVGKGAGWTKETHGPVVIKGSGKRTVVRVSGPGGWKIVGGEKISD
ncbi:hypothetical protein ACFLZP_01765 [Patescibacteria group bacterium]